MPKVYQLCVPILGLSAILMTACQNESQAPASRPEPPTGEAPESGTLGPVDLIYVCGNKFLATNATKAPVEVTYRVAGTEEDGTLTLREAPGDDQSHSETEVQTRERGVVELYLKDQRVARRRNGVLPCGPSPMSASVAGFTAAESGSWDAPFPWPIIALHVMLLPDGKILSWGHTGQPQLWDPKSGSFTEVALGTELFCSGHTMLADGRILTAGGHITDDHGLPDINIFNPGSQSWSSSTPMRRGRWYPNTTLLSNGDVVIIAGRDEASTVVAEPEVWSSGSVRVLTSASLVLPYYPRAFLAPNGEVFYAGEEQTTRYLDPSGTGSWKSAGNRLYGIRDYGAAVMYDVGKILYVGGGRTTNTAEIVDLNSPTPVWQWAGSMANARRHLNATVLPTGEVLVTGGSSGTGFNDVALAVHAAELWNPNPAPLGTWKVLASNTVNRTYHATSILLPDGRVLHTGSGDGGGAPNENNAELFSPPYLFKGARPTLTDAPSSIDYGSTFTVTTPDASTITRVSLIHLGSVTHAFDMGQRFQWLSFQSQAGALTVAGPTSANVTPPGYYMLFALTSDSVPSVAKIIRVGAPQTTPPPNSAPSAGFSQTCTGLSCTFTDASTDVDGTVTGWSWNFGDGASTTSRSPSHTFGSDGTYTVSLTATDDDGATGTSNKDVTVSTVATNAPPTAAFSQVCTGLSCTFTDASSDTDGSVAGWSWDFGDGQSSTNQSPSHTFSGGGSYTVSLTATDDDGATAGTSKVIVVTAPAANAAPTAAFSQTCASLSCTFTDASTDTDGSVTAWSWRFGDGGTSTTRSPNHTFASAGTFTVTLTATDDDGAAATTSTAISVVAANKAPTAAFSQTCSGLSCTFTDGSTDVDGSVTGWSWNFGDGGTSTTRSPSHTFARTGTYTVALTATDDDGATAASSKVISVTAPAGNIAPTAAFVASCNKLTCMFTNRSTDADGKVVAWKWTFGNGTTSTGVNPSRTYAAGGTYTVTLTVTDNAGATNQRSQAVPITSAITVTASGRVDATKQYVTVKWTGARGTAVNLYRFGSFLQQEANDGLYTASRLLPGLSKYTFYVCELGSTTLCSNQATILF